MSTILLVEDDDRLRTAIAITLKTHGYRVTQAGSYKDATESFLENNTDCIVLDLGLPDKSGLQFISFVRQRNSAVPIIILSARRESIDKVTALDLGADDYVTKPFGIEELHARVRAAFRRINPAQIHAFVRTPDFSIDLEKKLVRDRSNKEIHLTPTEWNLLSSLMARNGGVVDAQELMVSIWGVAKDQYSNSLRVHIAKLRQKIEPEPFSPRYILNVSGLGYRFVANSKS